MKKDSVKKMQNVMNDTLDFLQTKKRWIGYDSFLVVNGVLLSVFRLVYHIAPDFKTAKNTIESVLNEIDKEHSD